MNTPNTNTVYDLEYFSGAQMSMYIGDVKSESVEECSDKGQVAIQMETLDRCVSTLELLMIKLEDKLGTVLSPRRADVESYDEKKADIRLVPLATYILLRNATATAPDNSITINFYVKGSKDAIKAFVEFNGSFS